MMIGQRPARGFDPYMPQQQPMFQMDVPDVQMPQQQAAPAKPKINWAAVLADGLAGVLGQQGRTTEGILNRRAEQTALERGEEQYRSRRADANADWMQREEWQRNNPEPSPMLRDANAWAGMTDAQREAYRAYQASKPRIVTMADGTVMEVGGVGPPPAATTPRRFDTLPKGAVPLGGPTPPASGTFPPYYR